MNMTSNMAVYRSRREIFGMPVCDLDWADTFRFVETLSDMPLGQTVISFLNANNANLMLSDDEYRNVLSRHLVLPDGIGVDLASLVFHGRKFPANLNGTDFVPALMTYLERPRRVGMIGARPEVLEKARKRFADHAPWHEFVAISDGYIGPDRLADVLKATEEAKVDILLIAMGTPYQEKWIDRHILPQHARLVISVGALFDFMAGEFPRAPVWMRGLRLEWFFRLVQEPKRLWYRYVVGIPLFFGHVVRAAFSHVVWSGSRRRA